MMTPVINALTPSTEWVDTIAMLGFSFAGILAARGRGVDPVGVFILAFTSAFGGVTVRDMLLDIRPFYWVSHEAFTWLIICFTIFAPVIAARLSDRIARELFLWADAV
ncbi:TRIC cation channel family protein, partial [Sutterella wadsworthensis]